jgi:hypothetical protein
MINFHMAKTVFRIFSLSLLFSACGAEKQRSSLKGSGEITQSSRTILSCDNGAATLDLDTFQVTNFDGSPGTPGTTLAFKVKDRNIVNYFSSKRHNGRNLWYVHPNNIDGVMTLVSNFDDQRTVSPTYDPRDFTGFSIRPGFQNAFEVNVFRDNGGIKVKFEDIGRNLRCTRNEIGGDGQNRCLDYVEDVTRSVELADWFFSSCVSLQ